MVTGSVLYLNNRKHDERNGGKEEESAGLLTKRKKDTGYIRRSLCQEKGTRK